MTHDDPKFVLEMLRSGALGIFNYGLGSTPPWMRAAILDVAEEVKRAIQGTATPVPIGGGLNAAPISADAALWYRAAAAVQALLNDPLGAEGGPAWREFCDVLWELPPVPIPK